MRVQEVTIWTMAAIDLVWRATSGVNLVSVRWQWQPRGMLMCMALVVSLCLCPLTRLLLQCQLRA
jgi:hypothetical protein